MNNVKISCGYNSGKVNTQGFSVIPNVHVLEVRDHALGMDGGILLSSIFLAVPSYGSNQSIHLFSSPPFTVGYGDSTWDRCVASYVH